MARKAKATHDAWVIGEHELPPDEQLPAWWLPYDESARAGLVLVHELGTDTWTLVTPEVFNLEYQWV